MKISNFSIQPSFSHLPEDQIVKEILNIISEREHDILWYDFNSMNALHVMECSDSVFKNVFSEEIYLEKLGGTSCIILKGRVENKKILNVAERLGFTVLLSSGELLLLKLSLEDFIPGIDMDRE